MHIESHDPNATNDDSNPSKNDPYTQILRAAQGSDAIVEILLATQKRRSLRLLDLYLKTPALPGLTAAYVILEQLAMETTSLGFRHLLRRAQSEIPRSVEALLAGDNLVFMNSSRVLMEIDIVIREWIYAPSRINQWECVTEAERNRIFSFGKVLDRVRSYEGVSEGLRLPEAAEYSHHSALLHPTMVDDQQPTADVAECAAEVAGHLHAVLLSALTLFESQPDYVGVTQGDCFGRGEAWNQFITWRQDGRDRLVALLASQGLYIDERKPRPKDWEPADMIRKVPQ